MYHIVLRIYLPIVPYHSTYRTYVHTPPARLSVSRSERSRCPAHRRPFPNSMEGKPNNLHPLEHGKVSRQSRQGGERRKFIVILIAWVENQGLECGRRLLILGCDSSLLGGKNATGRLPLRRHRPIAAIVNVGGSFLSTVVVVSALERSSVCWRKPYSLEPIGTGFGGVSLWPVCLELG